MYFERFTYFEQISDPSISIDFHHPRRLAESSCMENPVQQHEDYQQQFQIKKCVRIKNQINIVIYINWVFHEFS